eukprot:gene17264-biopygen26171
MPWNWRALSMNRKVVRSWEVVRDNPDMPWDWEWLSWNSNVATWEVVRDNPDRPWDWRGLSRYSSVASWEIVRAHLEKPWCWWTLSRRPDMLLSDSERASIIWKHLASKRIQRLETIAKKSGLNLSSYSSGINLYLSSVMLHKHFGTSLGQEVEWLQKNPQIPRSFSSAFRPTWSDGEPHNLLDTFDIWNVLDQYEDSHPHFRFLGVHPVNFQDPAIGDDSSSLLEEDAHGQQRRCISVVRELCNLHANTFPETTDGKTDFGLVVNMDPSWMEGSHWAAMYGCIDRSKPYRYWLYYYDSLGDKPPAPMLQFMKRFVSGTDVPIGWNTIKHQYGDSECGLYSISFIINCLSTTSSFQNLCAYTMADDETVLESISSHCVRGSEDTSACIDRLMRAMGCGFNGGGSGAALHLLASAAMGRVVHESDIIERSRSVKNTDVLVHEFGLLRHGSKSFLGASPDGVTEDGVMLEIKCPWRRKIDGTVPMQYYLQIQGQLAVTGLLECDYFEVEFDILQTEEEIEAEFSDISSSRDESIIKSALRGVFVEKIKYGSNEPASYVYPPRFGEDPTTTMNHTRSLLDHLGAFVDYESSSSRLDGDSYRVTVIWWKVRKHSTVKVHADTEFADCMIATLEDVWNDVTHLRLDKEMYDQRMLDLAPLRRSSSSSTATVVNKRGKRPPSPPQAGTTTKSLANGGYAFLEDANDCSNNKLR